MRTFQQKRKPRINYSSPFFLFLLLILAIILLISTSKVYFKSKKAVEKNEEIKKAIDDLSKRKSELEKETAKLETEEGIDEAIREKFDVVKPGESVLNIIKKQLDDDKIKEEKNEGFFLKIRHFIKKIF
ncbi:MAG: septum formation initiator family protein [Patescibacteria group bacterium]